MCFSVNLTVFLCEYTLTGVGAYVSMQQRGEAAHGGGNQKVIN